MIRQVEDLFLTDLWMMTPGGTYSATIKLGTHQTIRELFSAIEVAFNEQNNTVLGRVQKVIMAFQNLGKELMEAQVLCASDGDHKLQKLRLQIYKGYVKHREEDDGEVIIALTTAIFQREDGRDK